MCYLEFLGIFLECLQIYTSDTVWHSNFMSTIICENRLKHPWSFFPSFEENFPSIKSIQSRQRNRKQTIFQFKHTLALDYGHHIDNSTVLISTVWQKFTSAVNLEVMNMEWHQQQYPLLPACQKVILQVIEKVKINTQ